MKLGGLMPHSQGFSNNPYPEPNQFLVLKPIYLGPILMLSYLRLGLPKGHFPVGLPVNILKELPTWPAHLNF